MVKINFDLEEMEGPGEGNVDICRRRQRRRGRVMKHEGEAVRVGQHIQE